MLKKESSGRITIYKKKICQRIYANIKNSCFNFCLLFKKTKDSFRILERYINEKKLGYVIKKVSADGLCVIRFFQEGLQICYQGDVTIEELTAKLRSEALHNYNFYSEFSEFSELDNFLKNLLKYCNSGTVDLFLMGLGNAYQCRIVVYECTKSNTWTNDLRKYKKVLYFTKIELTHLDLVVYSKKIRNPDLFTESSDS